MNNFSVSE